MNKRFESYKKISEQLIEQKINFSVEIIGDVLYVNTKKALLTVGKRGVCILETKVNGAQAKLEKNKQSKTRKIKRGPIVSIYGNSSINTIVSDIVKL